MHVYPEYDIASSLFVHEHSQQWLILLCLIITYVWRVSGFFLHNHDYSNIVCDFKLIGPYWSLFPTGGSSDSGGMVRKTERGAAYYHLLAWSVPLVLTIITLAVGQVSVGSCNGNMGGWVLYFFGSV